MLIGILSNDYEDYDTRCNAVSPDLMIGSRLVAAGQTLRANVGGRRYLTFAGRTAERPVYLKTYLAVTNRQRPGLSSSG